MQSSYHGIFRKALLQAYGIDSAHPRPWTLERWCLCQTHPPMFHREMLGVGAAIEAQPTIPRKVGEERIGSLQALPGLGMRIRFEDNPHILVRTTNAVQTRSHGYCAPDSALIITAPLRLGAGSATISDIEQVPSSLLRIENGHRRPQRCSWVLAGKFAARRIQRGNALPMHPVNSAPVCQPRFHGKMTAQYFRGEEMVGPIELDDAAAFETIFDILSAR